MKQIRKLLPIAMLLALSCGALALKSMDFRKILVMDIQYDQNGYSINLIRMNGTFASE